MMRWWTIALCSLSLGLSTSGAARAQAAASYPDRPVRIVVPYSPGGGTDIIARLLAQKLNERWNQTVLVENRTGGNGNIGAQYVAQSKPDGYTILVSASAVTINPSLNAATPYRQSDFTPVILLATSPFLIIVNPTVVKATTFDEFVRYAKANEGKLAWASTAEGNAEHLAGSLLQQMAGFTMRHVPYKGGADAVKDVLGGHVGIGVLSLPTSLPYLAGGQLRVLAVSELRRAPQIPDVPTLAESGLAGFDLPTWYAVWLPAGTPTDIVDKVHEAFEAALKLDDVQKRVLAIGFNVAGGSRAWFADYTKRETEKYAKIISTLGLKTQ